MKQKINAKVLLADLRAGLDCPTLLQKYGINHKTFRHLTEILAEMDLLTGHELAVLKKESLDCEREHKANELSMPSDPSGSNSQKDSKDVNNATATAYTAWNRPLSSVLALVVAAIKSVPRWQQGAYLGGLLVICISILLLARLSVNGPGLPPAAQVDLKVERQNEPSERQAISELYKELLSFKNEAEFREDGFRVRSKYHDWLTKVETHEARFDGTTLAKFRAKDLIRLGSLFIASESEKDDLSRSKIENQSRLVMQSIEAYIKGPEPATSQAGAQEKRTFVPRSELSAQIHSRNNIDRNSFCYKTAYRFGRCSAQRDLYGVSEGDCIEVLNKRYSECANEPATVAGLVDGRDSIEH
jgi:hypothetical protein